MFVIEPVERSSITETSQPELSSLPAKWEPIKPAPPVIKARIKPSLGLIRNWCGLRNASVEELQRLWSDNCWFRRGSYLDIIFQALLLSRQLYIKALQVGSKPIVRIVGTHKFSSGAAHFSAKFRPQQQVLSSFCNPARVAGHQDAIIESLPPFFCASRSDHEVAYTPNISGDKRPA